jgi:hypothetical protein
MTVSRDTLTNAFEILRRELQPFVESRMRAVYGDRWETAAKMGTSAERANRPLDLAAFLSAIQGNRSLFAASLSHVGQAYASEIRDMRNRWAHQEPIDEKDADRALDTAGRLLRCIKATDAAQELDRLRGAAAPPLPNGLIQIARTHRDGTYNEENLDYDAVRKDGNYLLFKSYDKHDQIVNVKVHIDVVIEGAFGEIPPDQGFAIDGDRE